MHGRRRTAALCSDRGQAVDLSRVRLERDPRDHAHLGLYGDVTAFVCGVFDWASDPRIGRPPADRSKTFTLRRLIDDRERSGDDDGS